MVTACTAYQLLLHHCWHVADGNNFIAPELQVKQFPTADELERTYIYSLGMTVWYALEYQNDDGQEVS